MATTSTSPVAISGFDFLAAHHAAFDGDHKFRAQLFGLGVRLGMQLVVENDLRDSGAVAQVDEDQLAQVAPPVHPAHQHDVFIRVRRAQRAAVFVSASNFREYQASVSPFPFRSSSIAAQAGHKDFAVILTERSRRTRIPLRLTASTLR